MDLESKNIDIIEKLIEKVSEYNSVIIIGAGISGLETYNLLKPYSMSEKILAFVDNSKKIET